MVFLTSWVMGYLISQIGQHNFWEAMFLGLIFNLKNLYPYFLIKCKWVIK